MSQRPRHASVRKTYEFIKAHQREFPVEAQCRVLGVAPSGYYAGLKKPVSARGREDARLLRLIRASYTASQGIYGAFECRRNYSAIRPSPPREAGAGVDCLTGTNHAHADVPHRIGSLSRMPAS